MKKILCTLLAALLVAVMALTFAACGEKEPEVKGPTEDVSIWHAEKGDYPELKNQVSWEGINAMPIGHLCTLCRFYGVSADYVLGLERKE